MGGQIQRKPSQQHALWIASTIMVHAGKHYKALIDSRAAILLIQYSTYQHIDNSFKTPIQPTTAKLSAANASPMTSLCMMALHLRIADFKFTHNFIICDRLPDTGIIFWNRCSQESLHFLSCGTKRKIATYKKMENFLMHTQN